MDLNSFLMGLGAAFLFLLLVAGPIAARMVWRNMTKPFRYQVVTQTTRETPAAVVVQGCSALIQGIILLLAFGLIGICLVEVFWLAR